MGWLIGGGVLVPLVAAVLWFFLPTLRLVGRPDFEPVPKDPASVDNALMMRMPDAGQ